MEAAEVEPRLECFVKALRVWLGEDQLCCLLDFCANMALKSAGWKITLFERTD